MDNTCEKVSKSRDIQWKEKPIVELLYVEHDSWFEHACFVYEWFFLIMIISHF